MNQHIEDMAAANKDGTATYSGEIHYLLLKYSSRKRVIFKCPSDNLIPRMNGSSFDTADPNMSMCDWAQFESSYQWRLPYSVPPADYTIPSGEIVRAATMINAKSLGFYDQPTKLGIARDAVPFHRARLKATSLNWAKVSASNLLFLDGHVKLTYGDAYVQF